MANKPCHECGSSDGVQVYPKGDGFCFVCRHTYPNYYGSSNMSSKPAFKEKDDFPVPSNDEILATSHFTGYESRGISKKVDEFYGVRTTIDQRTGMVLYRYYPYIDEDGDLSRWKVRRVHDKKFKCTGKPDHRFFGQHLFNRGKMLVITEGEEDALAVCQVFLKAKYAIRAVSVPDGSGDLKCFEHNLDWLEGFDKIVLAYDRDSSGKEGVKKALKFLTPGKVFIAKLPDKDPSKSLVLGREQELISAIYDAEQYIPSGIVNGKDALDVVLSSKKKEGVLYFDGCHVLNKMTEGIRFSEVSLYTAGTSVGKTSFFKELEYHCITNTEHKVGIIHLEEQLGDSVRDLISIDLNKRVHLAPTEESEIRESYDRLFSSGKVEFVDHFASLTSDDLLNKIKFLAIGKGCKLIFLDHISIAVSEYAQGGNEREALDSLMTKLAKLAVSLNVWIGVICHLRKLDNKSESFEEGAVPSLDDLRGSGSLKQIAYDVVAFSRNLQAVNEEDRNIVNITVLKCRYTGRTGPAGNLIYDPFSGRMKDPATYKRDF